MKSRGFTIVEIMVVLGIIVILSSIVLAQLNTGRVKARDAQRISDIRQIQIAMEAYFQQSGSGGTQHYPPQSTWVADLQQGKYLPEVPTDPTTHVAYFYNPSSGGYCLGALLEESGNPHIKDSSTCDDGNTAEGQYKVLR